jgi:catechol 2,3-dioxygenase-like lactoylglutathione lyase family enzyme
VAPIFPVSDLAAALAYYRGLGFGVREWRGGGYGYVTFDGVEIHLGLEPVTCGSRRTPNGASMRERWLTATAT